MASSARPTAVQPTPSHWRLPRFSPNIRSARTARKTSPPAITGWTTDSGAIAIAATWKTHAPTATSQPIVNHLLQKRPLALSTGWRMSTVGAAHAPRCFQRNPRFVAKAQTSASNMPSCTVKWRSEAEVRLDLLRTRYAHLSPGSGVGLTLETEKSSDLDRCHRTGKNR